MTSKVLEYKKDEYIEWLPGKCYFCQHSKGVPHKQRSVPALLTVPSYFYHTLQALTHEGAFGNEYKQVTIKGKKFILSWKWPGDMFVKKVTGLSLQLVANIPLPVGEYGMWVDSYPDFFDEFQPLHEHQQFPMNKAVTKWRIGGGTHYLADSTGDVRCAAITSSFIFSEFWNRTQNENILAKRFCTHLKNKHNIISFPCHDQHHVFVFYTMVSSSSMELCTPEKMASRLRSDTSLRHFFVNQYNLGWWVDSYQQLFASVASVQKYQDHPMEIAIEGPSGWFMVKHHKKKQPIIIQDIDQVPINQWKIDIDNGTIQHGPSGLYLTLSPLSLVETVSYLQLTKLDNGRFVISNHSTALDFWDPEEPVLVEYTINLHRNQQWTIIFKIE